MNRSARTYRAFTLIELLVAVAIIGILLSMTFVAVAQARMRSRDAKRIADLRTIQSALEQYAIGEPTRSFPNDIYDVNSGFNNYLSVTPTDPYGNKYTYYRPACLSLGTEANPTSVLSPLTDPVAGCPTGQIYGQYGLSATLESTDNTESQRDNSPKDLKHFDLLP